MAAPKHEIVQMDYQNPHASMPLRLPVMVVCNTSDEDLERNVRANSAAIRTWVAMVEPHDRVAVLVGGGPSAADFLDDIAAHQANGAAVFAMNGASRWLRERAGIRANYQVISDAKPETATLVDPRARQHLFASQVHPDTMDAVPYPILWHLGMEGMEDWFPPERVKAGGYALIGGGATVGNSAICLAWAMGYRTFHLYGYDSCHRDGVSHAYDQPMNAFIPCATVEWAGRSFYASVAMKAQAEKFQITAQQLKRQGSTLHVHGDGLLQAMWSTPAANLGERDRYRLLWQSEAYREHSPGELSAGRFLATVQPPAGSVIIDFGCGTGRAGIVFAKAGMQPVLVDFVDNCRDDEALGLDFIEWDLTRPCPLRAPFGYCTDVMEHIPTEDVATVVRNVMEAAPLVWFQISTVQDVFGDMIGARLHNTVQQHEWWNQVFSALGFAVRWAESQPHQSTFLVERDSTAALAA